MIFHEIPSWKNIPGESRLKVLTSKLVFECDYVIYTIEPGFITDLASIPRVFWSLYPPDGKYAPAAVLHDCLYQVDWKRKSADKIFKKALKALKVRKLTRNILFYSVRTGGWVGYNNYTESQVKNATNSLSVAILTP